MRERAEDRLQQVLRHGGRGGSWKTLGEEEMVRDSACEWIAKGRLFCEKAAEGRKQEPGAEYGRR